MRRPISITKLFLYIIASLLCSIVVLWGVVMGFILTPEAVTPHVVGAIQQYTKSEVSIKSVDLSLFNRFPNITLKIDSLRITQTKDSIDDLLFARQCRVAINPIEILKNKNIAINHLSLSDARIYMYVDSLHGPLKTFILPEREEQEVDSLNTIDMSEYRLSLKRFIIDSAQIVIDDRRKQFYTRIENFVVNMSMDRTDRRNEMDVATGFSNLIVWREGELLVKKTSMELSSQMVTDRDSLQLRFEGAKLRVNDIDLKANGLLRRDTLQKGLYMDIKSSLNTPSISEFLALIPSSVIDKKERITTEGEVLFDANIEGVYSDTSYPTIGATLKIDNAKAKYESRKLELERVDCDAYAYIDLNEPKKSYSNINSLHINTSGIIDLTAKGQITNIIENAAVDLKINSEINFNRFTEIFPLNEGVICEGTNVSDINASFKVADIQSSNYANIYIDGVSTLNNLRLTLDASKFRKDTTDLASLHIQAEKGVILFGDNVSTESNSRTLRAKMSMQDLNYEAKSGERLSIKDVELIAGANFDRSSSKMNGVGVRGIAKNTAVSADSLFSANLESADITIIVKPKSEKRNAVIDATINSQSIHIDEKRYNADLNLSSVYMDFAVERDKSTLELRADANIHSEEITVDETNYNSKMKLSSVDMDISMAKTQDNKRSIEGVISFFNFWILSDIYPLDVTIFETSISMKERNMLLNNAHLTIGDSEIVATGNIHNLLHKMFVNPRASLSGKLSIHAPKLDFGAMIEASNHSVLMLEEAESEAEETSEEKSIVAVKQEPQVETGEEVIAPQRDSMDIQRRIEETGSMFLVPRKVDFAFDLNIDKALFWGSVVENFEGHATIKNRVLSLSKIELNAIGAKATGAMSFCNIDRKKSNLSGKVSLQDVDINRIGELFPSVHTMMPMLKSFKGSADFDLKANANVDNESQIDISTLYSAMRLKGRNLVLMDSETFAEISKKMMFKNKDRNLIDSLEVYALVSESKVDVLPFSITIDRYTAILGGSQVIDPKTFELDYNYHLSVMKSPLPFKAGIDIVGNLDDFDFKITKAKLKKTNFDEQYKIYKEYLESIEASEERLTSDIDARREKMKATRKKQRAEEARKAKEIERELEATELDSVAM